MVPRPLPGPVRLLCEELRAPPRLIAHLMLVHDAAGHLIEGLERRFSSIPFSRDDVLFGAATHDLGKIIYPEELTGPGHLHEPAGERLLLEHGISSSRARFARTHRDCQWDQSASLEELLVAVADSAWKGKRVPDLDDRIVSRICEVSGAERWEVFSVWDENVSEIANGAEERLSWQATHEA